MKLKEGLVGGTAGGQEGWGWGRLAVGERWGGERERERERERETETETETETEPGPEKN